MMEFQRNALNVDIDLGPMQGTSLIYVIPLEVFCVLRRLPEYRSSIHVGGKTTWIDTRTLNMLLKTLRQQVFF